MSLALSLYHDQLVEGGQTSSPLPPSPRLLYVRHGSAEVNGRVMSEDEAIFCDGPLSLKSTGSWAQIWRWDLAAPNLAPMLHEGDGVLSLVRMQRVIDNFSMLKGSQWLFRLDRIITPGGRVADRHQHPGPGLRCLIDGSFNVHQACESYRDLAPGDPWWETGTDTVVAWAPKQMAGRFLRGMVLPVEWEGKVTGVWLSGEPPVRRPGSWKLYVDQIVTV
jgi:hypothetical protein